MSNIFRDELTDIHAYHAPRPTGLVLLDAMENPYGLPPSLAESLAKAILTSKFNRYPDADAVTLKARLRAFAQVPNEAQIILGNGSDEILQMLMLALKPQSHILIVEPSFVMYRHLAHCCGHSVTSIPLVGKNFALDIVQLQAVIQREQPALILLANPNNPTGGLIQEEDLHLLVENAPSLLVLDEAYQPFSETTLMPKAGSNLVVMRTLSKMGLAGLRLGFACGEPEVMSTLEKVRLPYNINSFTQEAAIFLLEQYKIFDEQIKKIVSERQRMSEALATLPGFFVFPSAANFLCVKTPDANRLFSGLKKAGILVKNLNGVHPLLAECLRITVGSREENDQLQGEIIRLLR